jgi:hypothetical protein
MIKLLYGLLAENTRLVKMLKLHKVFLELLIFGIIIRNKGFFSI